MSEEKAQGEYFYDKAWGHRKVLAEQFVKLGVTDPFQLVQKLGIFEGKYFVDIDQTTGEPRYLEVQFPGEEHFFPTGKPYYRYVHLGEQLFAQPYYDSAPAFLLDYLDGRSFDAIIELGSGPSNNLVELFYRGGPQTTPLYGAEFTKSGVELANYIASLNPHMPLKSFQFDFHKPDLSEVKERGKILLFTSHSIEQVSEVSEELFKYLADFADWVTCIHFEPFGFQIIPENERGDVSKLQAVVADKKAWNKNLFPTLKACQQKGLLNLSFVAKNVMGRELGNPTSVAIWESKRSQKSSSSGDISESLRG